jgi:FKBP-type peptidyl-prolyl cis-trans isomerase 2
MRRVSATGIAVAAVLSLGVWAGSAWAGTAQEISEGSKVTLEYTLTLPDKTVADSNVGKEPFSYVQGQRQIVPGLEKALVGMKAGQKKHVTIPPEQAYGAYDDKARVTVDKAKVPPNVKAGTLLRASSGQMVTVLDVSDQNVTLDLNHPLAGKSLTFDVTVLKVENVAADTPSTGNPSAEKPPVDSPKTGK